MLNILILSVIAVCASGVSANKCDELQQVDIYLTKWKNNTKFDLDSVYVEELKDPNQHQVHCKKETLYKARLILEKYQPNEEILRSTEANYTIRALKAYSKGMHGVKLQDKPEEKKLKGFLDDVLSCKQKLYQHCNKETKHSKTKK